MVQRLFLFLGCLGLILIGGTDCSILGQAPANKQAAQMAAMKKLEGMVGDWAGSGWIEMGPQRQTFTSLETVQSRLNGMVLIIEGLHTSKLEAGGPEKVIHHALAWLSFDDQTNQYRMRPHKADGASLDTFLVPTENGSWQWGIPSPNGGSIRYTITLKEKKWQEVGEFSMDGKQWRKFFEMNLEKK
ncbi:MAG TPA: hypothetical protein PKZ53_04400 [Acidobacteriota bacterium]|nr:hypothetical protein [Acidobacteriota bacterium]HNG94254.1 hypothetical protein [Acidobacteriota bacterium]HNH83366.1 hypothetical protein [Acidobacteriota bacterium]HNJ39708.1 hypothetical protein [Acidobacteriota bacterium]